MCEAKDLGLLLDNIYTEFCDVQRDTDVKYLICPKEAEAQNSWRNLVDKQIIQSSTP